MRPADIQREMMPRLLTSAEVLSMPRDPAEQWILDRALRAGQLSLLVAKPRIGKSTFGVNLCLAVARGAPFLGRKTQKATTAYLSLDSTLDETLEIFQDFGHTAQDPVYFYSEALPQNPIAWLTQQIQQTKVRFAVVDTLQHFFKFQDANQYSEVTNRMGPLLAAARRHNCHVCFLHHARKGDGDDLDSGIGSQAIKGNCSSFIHLKKLPNSEQRVLTSDFRRGSNFDGVAIGFGPDGWLEVEGSAEEAEIKIAKPKVLKIFESDGELTEKEISDRIDMRQWIVGQAIRQLVSARKIERSGKGRKGSPYRYSTLAGEFFSYNNTKKEDISGEESEKLSQVVELVKENASPKNAGEEWEKHGEEKLSGELGEESGDNKNGDPFLPVTAEEIEILSRKDQQQLEQIARVKSVFPGAVVRK